MVSNKREVTIFVLALMFMFALASPCVAFSVGTSTPGNSGTAPGGCHGHHGPMPKPTHSCCYATQAVPIPVQITRPLAALQTLSNIITFNLAATPTDLAVTEYSSDASPPLFSILRI